MATCDFCNETTSSPTLYPAAVVQQAARTGFRAAGVATTEQMARSLGLTGLDAGQAWVDQVMADSTDWALCEACTRQFEDHLARRSAPEQSSPRLEPSGTGSREWRPSRTTSVARRRIGVVLELTGAVSAIVFFALAFTGADWWTAGLLLTGLGLMGVGRKLTRDR